MKLTSLLNQLRRVPIWKCRELPPPPPDAVISPPDFSDEENARALRDAMKSAAHLATLLRRQGWRLYMGHFWNPDKEEYEYRVDISAEIEL